MKLRAKKTVIDRAAKHDAGWFQYLECNSMEQAEHIVRAVNAFEPMKLALEAAMAMIHELSSQAGDYAEAFHDDQFNAVWNDGGVGYETSEMVASALSLARSQP
jgi:hypothetical protein